MKGIINSSGLRLLLNMLKISKKEKKAKQLIHIWIKNLIFTQFAVGTNITITNNFKAKTVYHLILISIPPLIEKIGPLIQR